VLLPTLMNWVSKARKVKVADLSEHEQNVYIAMPTPKSFSSTQKLPAMPSPPRTPSTHGKPSHLNPAANHQQKQLEQAIPKVNASNPKLLNPISPAPKDVKRLFQPPPLVVHTGSTGSCAEPSRKQLIPLSAKPKVSRDWVPGKLYSLLPGRLSFTAHDDDEQTIKEIRLHPKIFFFSTDLQERYAPLCADFGPVNLGILVRFCDFIREKMNDRRLQNRHLVYYCTNDFETVTNTAFLLGAYLVLEHGFSPESAVGLFSSINKCPIIPFRDATWLAPTFELSMFDCLAGLQKAVKMGWFSITEFDLETYDFYDDPRNGDMHRVNPKFVAFRGPDQKNPRPDEGAHAPSLHTSIFKKVGVSTVIRLNDKDTYDKRVFERAGFKHVDLFFDDCTTPPDSLVWNFFEACDSPGTVAVHCLAGLGRTGTLISLWMMKYHNFTAREAIGWLRIVRPGSVIGPQQHYLERMEMRMADGSFPSSASSASQANTPDSSQKSNMSSSQMASSVQMAEQVAAAINARARERRGHI